MVDIKKFTNMDLYGMIGVEISATESDVSCLFISILFLFLIIFD